MTIQEIYELIKQKKESAVKDLEDYEELKNLMGTPIQDIMKRLKILEILKKELVIEPEYNFLTEKYDVFIYGERGFGEMIKIEVDKDKGDLLKEWLDGNL